MSSIPGSERSPGGWHGNPLQHSCLENPVSTGSQTRTQLKWLSTGASFLWGIRGLPGLGIECFLIGRQILNHWATWEGPPLPVFLSCNWQNCKMFKVYILMVWYMYTLWKDVSHRVNEYIHQLTDVFSSFFCVRTFRFYFLSRFQFYNTMLSSIVTMLYVTSLSKSNPLVPPFYDW